MVVLEGIPHEHLELCISIGYCIYCKFNMMGVLDTRIPDILEGNI